MQKRVGDERPLVIWIEPGRARERGMHVARRDERILHEHRVELARREAGRPEEDQRVECDDGQKEYRPCGARGPKGSMKPLRAAGFPSGTFTKRALTSVAMQISVEAALRARVSLI